LSSITINQPELLIEYRSFGRSDGGGQEKKGLEFAGEANISEIDRDFRLLSMLPHACPVAMSSKYAFTQSLKELRFLFCQTSEHSAATRFGFNGGSLQIPKR
jgi:hypothetical protein